MLSKAYGSSWEILTIPMPGLSLANTHWSKDSLSKGSLALSIICMLYYIVCNCSVKTQIHYLQALKRAYNMFQ